jgi:hypothetical protein
MSAALIAGGMPSVQIKTWSESAYEWLLRSQQQQAQAAFPHDPSSAAWSFVRPGQGTGVSFIDAVLKKHSMPVIELQGDHRTGKSWTLLTLAARFVVSTRASGFPRSDDTNATPTTADDSLHSLPQVVLLDSHQDVLGSKILASVRTALLRTPEDMPEETLQKEIAACLGRIHVVMAEDVVGWVATLEALRCKLSKVSEHPTLILWDGFLSDIRNDNNAGRTEITRQVTRLLKDCKVLLITTSTTRKYGPWDNKLVAQRIRLERLDSSGAAPQGQHDFVATFQDVRIPFSIARGSILC